MLNFQSLKLHLIAVALSALIFMADSYTVLGVAAGIPYLFAVLVGVGFATRAENFVWALIYTALIVAGYFLSPSGADFWVVVANRGLAIFAVWVTTVLILILKSTTASQSAGEARFRDFAEVASDWLWEMDADLRFVYLSDRVESVTGVPVEFHLGKTREDLAGEDYRSEKWVALRTAIETRSPIKDFQYSRRGPDGIEQYISVSGKPIFDAEGNFDGYRGSGTDVSEQKSGIDRAQQAEQQLRTAIESLEDGFVIYDAEDRLLLCNTRYKEIYHDTYELLVEGAAFEDLLHAGVERGQFPDAVGREDQWVEERMRTHLAGNTEIEQRLSNGKWLKISERKTPDGGIVGVRVDITHLKQVQEKAEAANLAKSNFLSTMSHEIRTPLNGVLGVAQLLNDSELDQAQRRKVNTILSSGQTLLAIINDVLDMSRIEAGGLELEVKPFLMNDLVSTIATPFQTLADDKGLFLRVENSSGEKRAMKGDPVRIRQILWNLLSNAIKFTEKGDVRLVIDRIDGKAPSGLSDADCILRFVVTDTGAGISEDRVGAIFDAFTQEDSSITRKHGGTGLGLSIVKQLAELMGGSIDVKSEVGAGTEFSVQIPFELASEEEAEFLTLQNTPSGSGNSQSLNVLLAEDNEVNAIIAIAFLEKLGHTVRHAENGKIAVQIAAENWADLILMDVHMPVMNGIDATKVIRATQMGKSLPVIGLTAEAFAERHIQFIEAGMMDVLTKPYTEQQLKNALAFYGKKNTTGTADVNSSLFASLKKDSDSTKQRVNDAPQSPEEPTPEPVEYPVGNAEKLEQFRQQLGDVTVQALLKEAEASLIQRMIELRAGIDNADSTQIKEAAHAIIGAAGSMFATEVSRQAAIIEELSPDVDAVRELMPEFEIAADEAMNWWRACAG